MMEQIISEVSHLTTPAGFFALVNVILIDIVMSGDNAIVIGLAVKDLQGTKRRQTIALGIFMATVMRIIFAFFAVFLLKIIGLKTLKIAMIKTDLRMDPLPDDHRQQIFPEAMKRNMDLDFVQYITHGDLA